MFNLLFSVHSTEMYDLYVHVRTPNLKMEKQKLVGDLFFFSEMYQKIKITKFLFLDIEYPLTCDIFLSC